MIINVKKVIIKDILGNIVLTIEKPHHVVTAEKLIVENGKYEKYQELEVTATAENIISGTDEVKTALGIESSEVPAIEETK